MSELNHVPVVLGGMSSIGAYVCHHLPVVLGGMSSIGAYVSHHLPITYGECCPEGHVYVSTYLLIMENVVQRCMCMSALNAVM